MTISGLAAGLSLVGGTLLLLTPVSSESISAGGPESGWFGLETTSFKVVLS